MVVLEVINVSKKFKEGKKEFYALKNVSLKIEKKEIFALLGPNGSGKTTLINIILTILIPENGNISIFGKNPFKEKEVLTKLNYVSADKPYSSLKVRNYLLSYAKIYGVNREKVNFLIEEFKLKDLENSKCWSLSTGELTRVNLAKAMLNDPKLLILDEPTFGLDPKTKNEIHKYLKKLNKSGLTIFFASHDMSEVERLAEKVAFIKNGKILEVKKKNDILKKYGNLENYWLRLGK